MAEKPADLRGFGSFQNRLRSVSSPDLLELAAASNALPHLAPTDAAPPEPSTAAPSDPKTIRSRALQRLSETSQQQQQQQQPQQPQHLQHSRRVSAGSAIPNGVTDRGAGGIEAVSMQSDVTDVSVSGGSGTACNNDLGWLDEEVVALAERMQREVEVRDRHWRLRKYRGCFVGREAVRWMVHTAAVAPTEEDAVALGNAMLQLGLIAHVTYEHSFENRTLFYRFHLDSVSSMPDGAALSTSWGLRGVETGEAFSLAGEVSRLQRRVRDLSRELELQQGVDALLHEGSAALERRQRVIARRLLKVELAQRDAGPETPQPAMPAAQPLGPQLPIAQWQRMQTTLAVLQIATVVLVVVVLLRASESVGVKVAALMLLLLAAVFGMTITQLLVQLAAAPQHDSQTAAAAVAALPPAQQTRQASDITLQQQPTGGQLASAPGGRDAAEPVEALPSARHHLSSVGSARYVLQQRGAVDEEESGSEWSDFGSEASFQSSEQHQEQASTSTAEPGQDAPLAPPERQPAPNAPTPPPGPADLADWQDAPCLLRLKPVPGQRVAPPANPSRIPLNSGTPIEFESDMFAGRVMMWVKGLPTAPRDLFKGKRRRTRITVQGRFKRPVSFDEVITGQEFSRVKDLPAKWLVETVLVKMAKAISPSVEIGPLDAPSVLVPVVAMAQIITVSEPGQEPDMAADEAEDMRLCGPQLQDRNGEPVPAGRRRSFFMKPENRRAVSFEPDKVYTFHIFQHLVDCSTYELDLSVYRFDLTRYLDGQPLQFMMRTRGGEPIFAFELWHERLLPAAALATRDVQR